MSEPIGQTLVSDRELAALREALRVARERNTYLLAVLCDIRDHCVRGRHIEIARDAIAYVEKNRYA